MAILKCKMCSGNLEYTGEVTVVECDYCGTKQTIPSVKDENIQGLFNRANILRMKGEFDKAEQIYEKILRVNEKEAEAYWGIILCKYGIEYVEDPVTFKRVPTCHRSSFEAITVDEDYKCALTYADSVQRVLYEEEANKIDEIQKGILAISRNEKPYDVFICYKETDGNGRRTIDSTIANEIYYQLTQEGFKVFYAAITLEDKLGQEYEPYIFAALNSAKVMLSIGTKPEYFNAVWVKNEWSRFLKIMKVDRSKMLIPCYRDMDAYELPEEFAHLQAQDMSKIGFVSDLIRGIKKVLSLGKETDIVQNVNENFSSASLQLNIEPLLRRVFMFLEDKDWESADEYCEKVLDQEPENAKAYLGKLMAELHVSKEEALVLCKVPFDKSINYKKVMRFAGEEIKSKLQGYVESIKERNENQRLDHIYHSAKSEMEQAKTEEGWKNIAAQFDGIREYKDADALSKYCLEMAEAFRKDLIYEEACAKMENGEIETVREGIVLFASIPCWRDAAAKIDECRKKIEDIKNREIAEKEYFYRRAVKLMEEEKNSISSLEHASDMFWTIVPWKDAEQKIEECTRLQKSLNYRIGGRCQYCGGEFKGLFNKVCVKCGKQKDY